MAVVSISMSNEQLKMLDEMVEFQQQQLEQLGILANSTRSSIMAKLIEDKHKEVKNEKNSNSNKLDSK